MKLKDWLELQGAKKRQVVTFNKSAATLFRDNRAWYFHGCSGKEYLEHVDYSSGWQLYDWMDGQLQRIDKPIVKCRDCGKEKLLTNSFIDVYKGLATCPDCQKKEAPKQDQSKKIQSIKDGLANLRNLAGYYDKRIKRVEKRLDQLEIEGE